jgi:polar amino acid transport system substrate-binding protein
MTTIHKRIIWTAALAIVGILLGSVPILAAETYTAGIEAAFPPWAYAEKGQYKGITVEAVKEIAGKAGFNVEFKDLPWPSLIPALKAKKIDILVTGLSVTCERDKVIDYTIPFFALKDVVLVKKNSDFNIATALSSGARIGVQGGSSQYSWVENNLMNKKSLDVKVSTYEDFIMAVEDMFAGRVDAVIVDQLSALEYLNKGRPMKIVGTIENPRSVAIAVPNGDPKNLLSALNRGFVQLYESGKWAEILRKFLPKGVQIQPIPTFMAECIETYKSPVPGLNE